ncbi:hypothetical protein [Flavobacterium endoglycinae]|uniref:hypothetical protein n=1 Tax=Flavobacterium endoglycinae TaxID=2816357 RepID=UPI001EEFBE2F|nr:hypothetical protein [Flavobacterium endoglycinae]
MEKYKIYDRDFRVNAVKLGLETNFLKRQNNLAYLQRIFTDGGMNLAKTDQKAFAAELLNKNGLQNLSSH